MRDNHKTSSIMVGNVGIGGDNPVSIQSMTNTATKDYEKTLVQIYELYYRGCELVRVALPSKEEVDSFEKIVNDSPLPIIADIHFDHSLAISAIERGASKVRINPGNIGSREKLKEVVKKAGEYGIPLRIGVNSGSVERKVLKKYGGPTPEALVESALNNIEIINDMGFYELVVSLKASRVMTTINAYKKFSEKSRVPLHLGVTEAGTFLKGTIKNSIGIGSLLAQGIGDTLRVSLTGSPLEEVEVAEKILQSLELRGGIDVISCPTCARTSIDVKSLAERVEKELTREKINLTIAVMGCSVNGPGEAKEADIGIAGGKENAVIFKGGRVVKKVPGKYSLDALLEEIEHLKKQGD